MVNKFPSFYGYANLCVLLSTNLAQIILNFQVHVDVCDKGNEASSLNNHQLNESMKKMMTDVIEKHAENVKKQILQVNKRMENLVKQNDDRFEEIKQLVVEMKNEIEQLKKKKENLMTDQHNATNQPPEEESKFYSLEYWLTEGFKKFIHHETNTLKITYMLSLIHI